MAELEQVLERRDAALRDWRSLSSRSKGAAEAALQRLQELNRLADDVAEEQARAVEDEQRELVDEIEQELATVEASVVELTGPPDPFRGLRAREPPDHLVSRRDRRQHRHRRLSRTPPPAAGALTTGCGLMRIEPAGGWGSHAGAGATGAHVKDVLRYMPDLAGRGSSPQSSGRLSLMLALFPAPRRLPGFSCHYFPPPDESRERP